MTTMLRRHGATMTERHGRLVAAHYGSAATEVAVCRSHAGLAERSDRATLELRGSREDVDDALEALSVLPGRAWPVRLSPGRAIVRCEGEDAGVCTSAMLRPESAAVDDVSLEWAALELVGPRAKDVLEAAGIDEEQDAVTVVREGPAIVELLVARTRGPALWNRLLEAGERFGLSCVGLDALEQLSVSEHAVALRGAAH
jgi:glycine cleavage system aminomethyltransferase T